MMKSKLLRNFSILFFGVILIFGSFLVFFLGKNLDKEPIFVDKTSDEFHDVYNYLIDFETLEFISSQSNITSEKAFSGSNCGFVTGFHKYSPAVLIPIPSSDSSEIDGVNVNVWLSSTSTSISSALVFSVLDQNNNQILWDYLLIDEKYTSPGNWYTFDKRFDLPGKFVNSDFKVKIYLWNKDKSDAVIYIDDVSVSFRELNIAVKPRTKLIDFEKSSESKISSKYATSGFYSSYAKGKDDLSSPITIPLKELNLANIHSISYSFNFLSENDFLDAVFEVAVLDKNNNELVWNGIELSNAEYSPKNWETANGSLIISKDVLDRGEYLSLRLLNRNDNPVYIDDVYVVVKQKNHYSDSILPAHNMMKNPNFTPKLNQPPYDFVDLKMIDVTSTSDFELNNIFTKNQILLIGKFDQSKSNKQLLIYNTEAPYILEFENAKMHVVKVKFFTKISYNSSIYAENDQLFVFDKKSKTLMVFQYDADSQVFMLKSQTTLNNIHAVVNVVYAANNILSVIEADGKISNFQLKDDTLKLISTSKPIFTNSNNLKTFKSSFYSKNSSELLCIYLEKNNCKYALLEFNNVSKSWELSAKHQQKSMQYQDKLDYMSDYFIADYDGDGISELLQLTRNPRFCLRIISFNSMTYSILYETKFKGFKDNQNPKYYELTRMISADFTGDNKSEIIVFQDNVSKVNWLDQKTEIYTFGN